MLNKSRNWASRRLAFILPRRVVLWCYLRLVSEVRHDVGLQPEQSNAYSFIVAFMQMTGIKNDA